MAQEIKPLAPEALHRRCPPDSFSFRDTSEIADLSEMLGQARAVEAIEFATGTRLSGFNLFVLGPPGSGRHTFLKWYLSKLAANQESASDWCYVNNFDQPREPLALALPAGEGSAFCSDLEQLVDEAYTAIPTAFESEDYRRHRQEIEEQFGQEQARRFQDIQERARKKGIAIIRTPTGIAFAPVRDGEAIPPDEYRRLSDKDRERLEKETEELSQEVQETMQAMPGLVRSVRAKVKELDRRIALLAAGSLIDDLVEKYSHVEGVVNYLRSVQADIIENFQLFLVPPEARPQMEGPPPRALGIQQPKDAPAKRRYCANLLVDNGSSEGAPLIFEDHPTYRNLLGEIEYLAQMGTLVTDFSLIKGGALHRANGGYLVLDAYKVLTEPFAWQALKVAIKSGEIRIESLGEAYGLIRTVTLEPQPIPLDLKVVLIGDRMLYYLLQAFDPEFKELFKVAADFDDRMELTSENRQLFAQMLAMVARSDNLRPLDRAAVARVLDESVRHAEHQERISAQVRRAADIVREADYWAGRTEKNAIEVADVERAIESRIRRESRLRDRYQEAIEDSTILIATEGARVGQVNGLAVIQLGDFAFARPSRITARIALGSGKVIDIERETELGGPLHSKGVLILSGYLQGQYAADLPLSLSASLVMEQSYSGVEGDSASAAELFALLSAIGRIPLKQSLAVTGSLNQQGDIQSIGAVNQKIEGFFDTCLARGLTDDQGVIIPATNKRNLMLRQDVVEAVAQGRFAVYAVSSVNEAIALLTGLPAGEADSAGNYPEGTVNHRVRARLIELSEQRRKFALRPSGSEKE